MRGTGAEQPVVGRKVLSWDWTEGAAVFRRGAEPTGNGRSSVATAKPFSIPKRDVWDAFQKVKANQGAAGVDGQSIAEFEADLANNLYRLWNRMSSGSYFPPPVRAVPIPKKSGGERILGVPTVADRVAQMVVKRAIESTLESIFLADSYGYRPNKSALDAVGVTRERCWKYDWVLEFDIRGLFDNWQLSTEYVWASGDWTGVTLDDVELWDPSGQVLKAERIRVRALDRDGNLVALDARTGKRLWHFQVVHHDLWDYDVASPPALVTLRKDGREIPVVVLEPVSR